MFWLQGRIFEQIFKYYGKKKKIDEILRKTLK